MHVQGKHKSNRTTNRPQPELNGHAQHRAFVAWGLITALFISTGWWPNEKLATLVSPMLTYLLPLLIAYTQVKTLRGCAGPS